MKRSHLCAFAILLVLVVLVGLAATRDSLLGTAQVTGPVLLNGQPASGPAIVLGDGDRLETGSGGSAVLMFSARDTLVLLEASGITLRSRPEGVSAQLNRGHVLVSSHERLHEVRLADEAVSIRATPGTQRRYQVSRLPDATYVLARAGNLMVFDEGYGTRTEIPEGKAGVVRPEAEVLAPPQRPTQVAGASATTQAPRPAAAPPAPAGGQRAGQITAAIPKDYIVRGSQQGKDGNPGDAVLWNDLLRTEPRGRVRIRLDDGSILNVGSDSRLKVVEHNTESQQTSLQLGYGRMRAQVVALTRPGAKFEVRTNTAVCGVLGTDFYIEATEKTTRVIVFKGIVRVTPLIAGGIAGVVAGAGRAGAAGTGQAGTAGTASAGQAGVTVTAGQATTVAVGSVSAPVAATAAQVQTAISASQAATTAGSTAAVAGVAASRVAVVATAAVPAAAAAAAAAQIVSPGAVSPTKP